MLVKLLANLGSNDFPNHPFLEGEEHDVGDSIGRVLVARRLAVDITPPPEPVSVPVPKQEPAVEAAPATAPKTKTSKEK